MCVGSRGGRRDHPGARTDEDLRRRSAGGDVLAVDDIELEINSGEIYGLLGPNGAGKSTTIGMLTTRVVPDSAARS